MTSWGVFPGGTFAIVNRKFSDRLGIRGEVGSESYTKVNCQLHVSACWGALAPGRAVVLSITFKP